LSQARAQNPRVVLVVAQIHKIRPDCNAAGDAVLARAEALVNAVPGWARGQDTAQSRVLVADLWTNSGPSQSIGDCVHPDQAGAQRMGRNWFNALRTILNRE
jgi:hypothetical protein